MIPTPPLLLLLVLALPFLRPTHAAIRPPKGTHQDQARFNCPDVPLPGFLEVDRTTYPRMYPVCFDIGCDCEPDPRDPRGFRYHVVCRWMSGDAEEDVVDRLCMNTCSCYGGPPDNFVKWPQGPAAVGPVLRSG